MSDLAVFGFKMTSLLQFEKEGIHKNAVCIDGKYENHVFMALLLGVEPKTNEVFNL
jgi:hypothetical protein